MAKFNLFLYFVVVAKLVSMYVDSECLVNTDHFESYMYCVPCFILHFMVKKISLHYFSDGAEVRLLSDPLTPLVFLHFCMLGYFPCFCCHLLTFFKSNFFKKNLLGTFIRVSNSLDSGQPNILSVIDIRTNTLSVLIWVQIVCKDYN